MENIDIRRVFYALFGTWLTYQNPSNMYISAFWESIYLGIACFFLYYVLEQKNTQHICQPNYWKYFPECLVIRCKVIIKKFCGETFLWNRIWDLGWFWAGWQYWKVKTAHPNLFLDISDSNFFTGKKNL